MTPIYEPEPTADFITREEAHKAAHENGFRIPAGERGGWIGYRSTTAHGEIWIARDSASHAWLLAITHSGVATEMTEPEITAARTNIPGAPGFAAYAFPELGGLYRTLDRVYKLGVSLPDAPLDVFRREAARLPQTTEAERVTVVRVGQDIFRRALMDYWNGQCPLTGITDPALLRASHIVAWADCDSDAQRLDVHNGLLLSALWDAAFDAGLISFTEDGTVLRSPNLSQSAASVLHLAQDTRLIGLTAAHLANLARHRTRYGYE